MKKMVCKMKQILSILLSVVIIVTTLPQNVMTVAAEEVNDSVVSQITESVDEEQDNSLGEIITDTPEEDAPEGDDEESEEGDVDSDETIKDEDGKETQDGDDIRVDEAEEDENLEEEEPVKETEEEDRDQKETDVITKGMMSQENNEINLILTGDNVTFWDETGTQEIQSIALQAIRKSEVVVQVEPATGYAIKRLYANKTNVRIGLYKEGSKNSYKLQYVGINEDYSDVTITAELVEAADQTITITNNSDQVSAIKVMQNGIEINANEDGTYSVSNEYRVMVTGSIADGYLPVIKDTDASDDSVTEVLADELSVEGGSFTYTRRMFENHAISIDAKKSVNVTVHMSESIYMNMLKVVDNSIASCGTYIQDGTVLQIYKGEDLILEPWSDSSFGTLQIASTKEFAEADLWKSIKDKYSSYENYDIYNAFYRNITSDCDVYVRIKAKEVSVEYPEGIELTYVNPEGYTVSKDGKTIYLSSETTVRFKATNKTGKDIFVTKTYRNDWANEDETETYSTEIIGPSESETGETIYEVSMDSSIVGIEIANKSKISFQGANVSVYDEEEIGPITEMNRIKGSIAHFRVEPKEGYEVDYVSLTGKEADALQPVEYTTDVYEFIVTGDVTVTIRAIPLPKSFTVINEVQDDITATITTNDKVKYHEELGCYRAYYGARQIEVKLRASKESTVVPKVYCIYEEGRLKDLSVSGESAEGDDIVYTCQLEEDELEDFATIYIADATKEEGTLKVSYDAEGIMSVQVKDSNGRILSPTSTGTDIKLDDYPVKCGQTYQVTVTANTDYCVGTVKTIRAGNSTQSRHFNTRYTFELPVTGNETYVDIESCTQKKSVVTLMGTDELQQAGRNTQTRADYYLTDGLYKIAIKAKDESVGICRITARGSYDNPEINGNPLEYFYIAVGTVDEESLEEVGDIPVIEVQDTRYDYIKLALADGSTYMLQVYRAEEVTGITVKYVRPEIPVDTAYMINVQATSSSRMARICWNRVKYEISCDSYVNAHGETVPCVTGEWWGDNTGSSSRRFRVIAGDVAGKTATIKFYTTDPSEPLATFNITTTDTSIAKLQEVEPVVTFTKNDDVSVSLNVKGVQEKGLSCYAGKQYYMITAVPKSGEHPATIANSRTWYIPRTFPEYPDEATDAQIQNIDKNYSQDMKLILNEVESGNGVACDFDVQVSLIQTKTGVNSEDLSNPIMSSAYYQSKVKALEVATKEPVFETKVSLKKKSSTVYSGQQEVLLATAVLSKATSCTTIYAEDITECAEEEKVDITVDDDGSIYASISKGVLIGNHIIQVVPTAGSRKMYQQPTTMTVKVVKGIESLKIIPDSYVLYKAKNKPATLSTSVKYNENGDTPKSKKVKYEIVNALGESIDEGDSLYGKIKIATNGKITLDKSFDSTDEDVQFCVKVTAADYANNEVTAISDPIQITSVPMTIETIKILKWNDEKYCYEVIGCDKSSLSTDQLNGAVVAAFANDQVLEEYNKYELRELQIPVSDYIIKSSKKAVGLSVKDDMYHISCEKVAKNVKLTATAKDGGKKVKAITITSTYYEPASMELAFSDVNGTQLAQTGTKNVEFAGTANTRLQISVREKNGEAYQSLPGAVNYSVTAGKGAKLIQSNQLRGEYSLLVTAEQATITLTNKALSKKDPDYKTVYTVKNNLASILKVNGPTVKTTATLKNATDSLQEIKFTVVPPKKNTSYSMDGKSVMVTLDEASAAKGQAKYNNVAKACDKIEQSKPVEIVNNNGVYEVTLQFAGTELDAGSYKLQFTFGTLQDDNFCPDSKPATVTLKVAKPKVNKGSLKPTTSYVVKKNANGTYANAEIKLAYSGKSIQQFAFEELYNCNNKGYENHFLDYFVFDKNTQTIKLNNNLSENDIAYITGSKGKNDRVAYIEYSAKVGDDGYGNPFVQRKVVKITVNFK